MRRISICLNEGSAAVIPDEATMIFSGAGCSVYEAGDECFLTDGSSTFALRPTGGSGTAYLSPAFTIGRTFGALKGPNGNL